MAGRVEGYVYGYLCALRKWVLLQGVKILAPPQVYPLEQTTGQDGHYSVGGESNCCQLTAEKPGFYTQVVPITIPPLWPPSARKDIFLYPYPPCLMLMYTTTTIQNLKNPYSVLLGLLALFSLFLPIGHFPSLFLFFSFTLAMFLVAGFRTWKQAIERALDVVMPPVESEAKVENKPTDRPSDT